MSYAEVFNNQRAIIERQQEKIDELSKYRDKYFEYKDKYESLLVFGVITNNEKLKRKN